MLSPDYSDPPLSIQYSDGSTMICEPNCLDLELLLTDSQSLTLEAISNAGCIARDTVNVFIEESRKVYIPNAFSPNGDEINDFFTIYGGIPNVQEVKSLIVFDRWGNVVFKNENFLPNDESQGWGGNLTNDFNPGVFAYIASIRFLDDKVINYRGDLTLKH